MPVTIVEREIGGRTMRLETGRVAKLAGDVLVQLGGGLLEET